MHLFDVCFPARLGRARAMSSFSGHYYCNTIILIDCYRNFLLCFCFSRSFALLFLQPCDAGFVCAAGLVSADGAVACSSGSYCARASGNETDCAVGQFCPTPNVTYACSQGSYCPARSTAQAGCPAGFFCHGVNQTQCTGGYLCPGGTVATDKGLVFTLAGNKVGGYRIDAQGGAVFLTFFFFLKFCAIEGRAMNHVGAYYFTCQTCLSFQARMPFLAALPRTPTAAPDARSIRIRPMSISMKATTRKITYAEFDSPTAWSRRSSRPP